MRVCYLVRTEIVPVPLAASSINETFDNVADLLLSSCDHVDGSSFLSQLMKILYHMVGVSVRGGRADEESVTKQRDVILQRDSTVAVLRCD